GQSVVAARAGDGRAAAITSPSRQIEWRTSRTSGRGLPAPGVATLSDLRGSCYKARVRLLTEVVDVDVPLREGVGAGPAPDGDRTVAAVVPALADRGGEPADRDVARPPAAAGRDHPEVPVAHAAAADLGGRVVGAQPRAGVRREQCRVEPPVPADLGHET